MIKTQIQLPDDLYHKARAVAEQRDWSLAEVVRRGVEYMTQAYPVRPSAKDWALPVLRKGDFRPDFDQLDLKELAGRDEVRNSGA